MNEITEKKVYFTKKGKTDNEIKQHVEEKRRKHCERMKLYNRNKKMLKNGKIKSQFDEMYSLINSLEGYTNVDKIYDKILNYSCTRYKCLCFDVLYEAYLDMLNKEK